MKTNLLFRIIIGLFAGWLGLPAAKAQTLRLPEATPGRTAVFVQCTDVLHGPRYRIERQLAGSRTWQEIHTTDTPPASAAELRDRLRMLAGKHPTLNVPSELTLERLWPRYSCASRTDSLYGFGAHPLMLEALGLGYMDEAVEPGQRYEYRVSPLGEATERLLQVAHPISIPAARQAFGARLVRAEASGQDVRMIFLITRPSARLGGLRMQRRVYAQTAFTDVPVQFGFRRQGRDSLLVEVVDPNVQRKVIYQYLATPTDFVGGEGEASDTLTITNLKPYDDLPTILSVRATSVEPQQAIRLGWRLSSASGLREIRILRATELEGPYRPIASALPTDTSFVDRRVEPIQTYYYQLILNGTYDQAPASVKFPGMLKASRPALLAPRNLFLTQTQDAITLRWQRNGQDTHGYYLYRGESVRGTMQQFGDVILNRDSVVTYTIKTADLPPAALYKFAVVAVNTSYNRSPGSDTVFSGPVLPQRLATPLNVTTLRLDNRPAVQLVWDDLSRGDANVEGYLIYRKEETEKDFQLLYRQTSDDQARNTHIDSTLTVGKSYQYAVRAYGLGALESALSTPAPFRLSPKPAITPRGLRVYATEQGAFVSWDAPVMPKLKQYRLYRYKPGDKPTLLVNRVPGETQHIDRSSPSPGLYYYAISSVDEEGQESPLSDPVGVNW